MIGWQQIIIIALIIILLFGTSKLPKLAKALRESADEFKKGKTSDNSDKPKDETPKS